MPLQLRSHCRRGPLGAAAFLQLWGAGWHARCCGESGAVACLVLWCICAVTHLAQRRTWHSGAFGTAAHLAQRHAWHSGALGAVVRMEKLGNSHQLPQIGPPFVYLGLSYTALNLFHAGLAR